MVRKVTEHKISKNAYFPSAKKVRIEEYSDGDEQDGEPSVTINGKPKDIQRFMSPKEKGVPSKRSEDFEEKDLEEVKFKGRDDDETSPGTPRSPLPGGIKKRGRGSDNGELSQMRNLQNKVSTASDRHSQTFDNQEIDTVFHSYSHVKLGTDGQVQDEDRNSDSLDDSDPSDDTNMRDVSKENAFEASMEVLRNWDTPLNDEEEGNLKKTFNELYSQYKEQTTGRIPLSQATNFTRDLFKSFSQQSFEYGEDEDL